MDSFAVADKESKYKRSCEIGKVLIASERGIFSWALRHAGNVEKGAKAR
jgi:hypothetical protein